MQNPVFRLIFTNGRQVWCNNSKITQTEDGMLLFDIIKGVIINILIFLSDKKRRENVTKNTRGRSAPDGFCQTTIFDWK